MPKNKSKYTTTVVIRGIKCKITGNVPITAEDFSVLAKLLEPLNAPAVGGSDSEGDLPEQEG